MFYTPQAPFVRQPVSVRPYAESSIHSYSFFFFFEILDYFSFNITCTLNPVRKLFNAGSLSRTLFAKISRNVRRLFKPHLHLDSVYRKRFKDIILLSQLNLSYRRSASLGVLCLLLIERLVRRTGFLMFFEGLRVRSFVLVVFFSGGHVA